MDPNLNARKLTATYSSPESAEKLLTKELPQLPQEPSTEQRTEYLAALRSSTTQMQKDVNEFLTQKMEEDKASGGVQAGKTKEDKEEENYGEEAEDV